MNYIDITKQEIEYQQKLLKNYTIRLQRLPSGRLAYTDVDNARRYYHVEAGSEQRKYINGDNSNLIADLKLKRHLTTAVKRLEQNIAAQKKLLLKYKNYDYKSIEQAIPKGYRSDDTESSHDFESAKSALPLNSFHMTSSGTKVRSKSEAMIVELLSAEGLTWQYEAPLVLKLADRNSVTVHPDFTFTDRYGNKIYWEHFGLLGNDKYRKDALRKIEAYILNGILPSLNLIITAENIDGTIDVNTIIRTIQMLKKML